MIKRMIGKLLNTGIISWVLFILVWQIASLFSKPDYLPGPITTVIGSLELFQDGSIISFSLISLSRVLRGWIFGVCIAIPLGLLIGRIRIARLLIEPFLDFFRFIPALAFLTLFVLWFGIDEMSKVLLIAYATTFIVTINTATGVFALEEDKIRAARSLGASEFQILKHVVIPSAIPYIFTGMRIAMGNSFAAIVGAEMIAANEGLGYLIWTSRLYFRTDWVFLGIMFLGILGFIADRILRFAGARALKKYGIKQESNFKN
jgi:NitT/TauT family transport system permease protein